ncbi:MAG: DNA replication/repair protein RecF [Lachnospiraceae bacterium]|nr:DNA replication/repair protein RecF [Lachnospiraceae bacterium]
MNITSLEVSDFRNYEKAYVEFDSGVNILYGNNAQGKTNLLEALFFGCTSKSQKGSKEREMIRFDADEAHIRIVFDKRDIEHKIDMHLRKNKSKGIAIDGNPIKKAAELYGLVNIVSFSPDDLQIIKNGPAERRRFMDMELCQLDRLYMHNLSYYNHALNQKNSLLKKIDLGRLGDTMDIWDEQLVKYGSYIIDARKRFTDDLNMIIGSIHSSLSLGKEELKLRYMYDVSADAFAEKLFLNRDRDVFLKAVSVGPHRDDLEFLINGESARKFGSQGQQRTTALSLKLAEIELVKNKIGDNPVLLLDDVLSELDRDRQTMLLDSIKDTQTMISCTGLEEFVENRLSCDRIYHVENGSISRAEKI